jgi:polyisoprenoid-binding protein YceI
MIRSNTQGRWAAPGNRLRQCALVLALVSLSALPAFAQTAHPDDTKPTGGSYSLNREHSKILFSISHFVVSSTEGQFTTFDGKLTFEPQAPEHGSVTIHVSPGSISTGNTARDDHLRTADFFDAEKFPLATFEGTGLVRTSAKTGKLTGSFSLHGVTRPVALNVTLQTPDLNADRLNFTATGTLKRSDFGMNQYLSVIGDAVTLTVEAEFDRDR